MFGLCFRDTYDTMINKNQIFILDIQWLLGICLWSTPISLHFSVVPLSIAYLRLRGRDILISHFQRVVSCIDKILRFKLVLRYSPD